MESERIDQVETMLVGERRTKVGIYPFLSIQNKARTKVA
jgi:hypothetical protein